MKFKQILTTTLLVTALTTSVSAPARNLIQNKGSDTLVNVAQAWAEAYPEVNPDVAVSVSGGGSGTGIAAMINGTVDIANASRSMKDKEKALAEKNGQHPVEHVVGYDALAVFIHKDNPAKSMTIEQLKDIYGRDPKVRKWSDMGITVPGCKDEIVVVSRQNNSGTYAYFKKTVLGKKGKIPPGHPGHARLQGRGRPGGKDALRHRLQRTGLRHGSLANGLCCQRDRWHLCLTQCRNRQRPQLSRSPARCSCTPTANHRAISRPIWTGSRAMSASAFW